MALIEFTERGIYCPQADVYIDPWKPVTRAMITHGHSDHARWGSKYYLSTKAAAPVIKHRLGDIKLDTLEFGETRTLNGVKISYHPAGHIIGSAQIRLEYKGEIWVASGDYKLEPDGITEDFESVKCHAFITESTFGLPVYKWKSQSEIFADINEWWRTSKSDGKTILLTAYSLGKAQRILQNLDISIGKIYTHGAIENINEVLRTQGIQLPETTRVTADTTKKELVGNIVIAPPSAANTPWSKRLGINSVGIGSGWMTLRGARRRRSADRGFVLSDHADWSDLNKAIAATGAEQVFVAHGYTKIFSRYLQEQGYDAHEVKTEYEGELSELNEESEEKKDAA